MLTPLFCYKNKHLLSAFTLIEVLIVLAILGILSAISYTMYQNYTHQAFQAEIIGKMQELKLEQSSLFATNGTYACDIESFSAFDDGGKTNEYVLNNNTIERRKFSMSISNCTSSGSNAHYKILAENNPSNSKWKVKWQLECGIAGNYTCKPELKQGKSVLEKIF